MESLITVEVMIRDKHRRFADLRACIDIKESDIQLAMTPIKTNDTAIGQALEGQRYEEQGKIEVARFEQASNIAHSLEEYIAMQLFAINDTHNGYRKDES